MSSCLMFGKCNRGWSDAYKQNLFFAFIYNMIGIGFAMVGLLNPMLAAGAMALSSISVLMNALRLTRLKG